MTNFERLEHLLYNEGIKLRLQKSWVWKILKKVFRSDVIAIGRTIYIPDESSEWLNSNYAFSTIAHEYTHYLDKKSLGIMYYIKWWFSDEERFELELRAYAVNILCGFVLNGKFDEDDKKELVRILFYNYNFDYTEAELESKLDILIYFIRGILNSPTFIGMSYNYYANSVGFVRVFDLLSNKKS